MRDTELARHARHMRQTMSEPETRLWLALRAKRFAQVKFRRQKVIGRYIPDLAARDPMLVIELDGDSHAGREGYDAEQTRYLNEQGYDVLRFGNADAMENLEGVLTMVTAALPLSQPSPLKGRGQ